MTEAVDDFKKAGIVLPGSGPETILEAAAKFFLFQGVKIGGVYRHWKGKEYKVTSVANDVDNWHQFRVHYVEITNAEHTGDRELCEFLGEINDDRYQGRRFTLVR